MHVVGTAGHVDHGKSTLVQAITGIDPDRFEEEKRRGLTIDLGFAWCTLPSGREIGIVDVPGHERFIRNMLAGTGAIDVVLFVVAADEMWKPQSTEHLQILDLLGISGGVVALTKTDTVDAGMVETARDAIWQRLRGSCLHDAAIVGVSAKTGEGLTALIGEIDALLDGVPESPDEGRPRLFVDRSFTIAGAGTVVTGTLAGGRLVVGQEVEVLPSGERARVRSLQTHKRTVDAAAPGSRVAVNLVGLERRAIERGDVVAAPATWRPSDRIVCRLTPLLELDHPFTERGAYQLYVGSAETSCRVRFLEDRSDAIDAVNLHGDLLTAVRPGHSVVVELFCERALTFAVGDRVVLRDVGRGATVAGAVVLDIAAGQVRRGDEGELRRLRAREGLRGSDLARHIVTEHKVIASTELAVLAGATLHDGPLHVDETYAADVGDRARSLVAHYHERHPLAPGIPRDELRSELGLEPDAFSHLAPTWDGLAFDGNTVRSASRTAALPAEDRALADDLLARLRDGDVSPPTLSDVGMPITLAKALERAGELVLISPDIAYPSDVWRSIRDRVVAFITEHGPASTSDLRAALGTTRKYAIPLLERLDADRVTRRRDDRREVV